MVDDVEFNGWLKGHASPEEYAEIKGAYKLTQLSFEGLCRSIGKYNGPNIYALKGDKSDDFELAVRWVSHLLKPHLRCTRILDVDSVVDAVDMTRSPGFPWNRKYQDAQAAFEDHSSWFKWYCEQVDAGLDPVTLWNYFPKEEILPSDKVDAGKLRQICGSGLELKLSTNRITLEQNDCLAASPFATWSKIGVNPFGNGWARLYHQLIEPGRTVDCTPPSGCHGIALDVSAFDANYQPLVSNAVKRVRWEAMDPAVRADPRAARILDHYYRHCYSGLGVLPTGEVLAHDHGNNSGGCNTATDNTIGNMIGIVYSWLRGLRQRCAQEGTPFDPDLATMLTHIQCAVYGDDNTLGGSKFARSVLTEEVFITSYADIGWKVTLESNGWEPVHRLTFLSKRFVFDKRRGWITFAPVDGTKALAALLCKAKPSDTPQQSYVRACGLRCMYWMDFKVRALLDSYLDYLEATYFYDTCKAVTAEIRQQRLSERRMEELYFGGL